MRVGTRPLQIPIVAALKLLLRVESHKPCGISGNGEEGVGVEFDYEFWGSIGPEE